jgi:DnaA-homolog protein
MQLALDLLLDTLPTFDNFVVGANHELLTHLRDSAQQSIYIWGETGSGKTHLLKALTAIEGVYLPASELSLDGLKFYPKLLAIDNLESISHASLSALFALQNHYRQASGYRLVIASRLAPKVVAQQLSQRDDVSSRLAWGLTLRVQELTDLEKAQAIAAFFGRRGTEISAEVIPYLLTRQSRNIKDLAHLADQLDRYAFAEKRAVTLPFVRQFLAQNLLKVPTKASK